MLKLSLYGEDLSFGYDCDPKTHCVTLVPCGQALETAREGITKEKVPEKLPFIFWEI